LNTQQSSGANPYQAPNAAVAVVHNIASDTLIKNSRRVSAGHGLAWIGAGWDAFKAFPGAWILFIIVFMLVMFALTITPLINLLAIFIMPVLIGGLMLACRDVDQGNPPAPGRIFAAFSDHLGRLALTGLLFLIGMIAIGMLIELISFQTIGHSISGPDMSQYHPCSTTESCLEQLWRETQRYDVMLLLALLLGAALMMPLTMAFYYAPALIVFHDASALDAMKTSFLGTLKNFLPFLVYGIAAMLLLLLGMLPVGLGLLIVMPVLTYSMYAGCKDIYVGA